MSQHQHNLEQLSRLLALLDSEQPVPADVAKWFVAGAESFIAGEEKTLCKSLGVRGPGQSSVLTQRQLARRNEWLCQAYGHVSLNGVSPWARCKRLAHAILQFESRTWPIVRDLSYPPDRLTELQRCLFYARKADALPSTPVQLSNICQ